MTQCAVLSDKDHSLLRRVGMELMIPTVINDQICYVSVSDQFLMYSFGCNSVAELGITEKQYIRLILCIMFLREDYKMLDSIYRHASRPEYMRLLFDYLHTCYGFSGVNFWVNKVQHNLSYINTVLANCQSVHEVKNKIPGLVNHLKN